MKCASSTTESQPESWMREMKARNASDKLVQTLGKNFQLCREGHKLCMASGLQILWIVANTFCQQAGQGVNGVSALLV